MRHLKSGKQLGRNSSHRKAMYRNMVVSLFDKERITTTDIKAKELRKHADKLITLGKRGTLSARRMARVMINDREVLQKLFTTLAERYKDRPGGYTRIIKLGMRAGDNAPLSSIQLVMEEMKSTEKPAKQKKIAKKKEVAAKKEKEETVSSEVEAEKEVVAAAEPEKVKAVVEDKDEKEDDKK